MILSVKIAIYLVIFLTNFEIIDKIKVFQN